MPYATRANVTQLYGESAVLAAATPDDGSQGEAPIDRALEGASAIIDGYVGARYPLPLAEPYPQTLVEACVDIALYRVSGPGQVTDEKRKRFEDWIKWLKGVQAGEISLGIVDPPASIANDVQYVAQDRVSSRTSLRGIL